MILKDLYNKEEESFLGYLKPEITSDGTKTLYNDYYNECLHCKKGARKESYVKYIYPVNFNNFSRKRIKVLDVCMGMGYNSSSIIEHVNGQDVSLDLHCLEIDKRPLEYSLNDCDIQRFWSNDVKEVLNNMLYKGSNESKFCKSKVYWGDARQRIIDLPVNYTYDLIMLDPFSPSKCPELWTEEFLNSVISKLALTGVLLTYSSSAAVRSTMLNKGIKIFSLSTKGKSAREWSNGTVGINRVVDESKALNKKYSRSLSRMEKEHLGTKASIPYRDPTNEMNSKSILEKRKCEQYRSSLESTSVWRDRWYKQNLPKDSRFPREERI